MRQLALIPVVSLLVLLTPAAVFGATWGPGCQAARDVAVKVWSNPGQTGDHDFECGTASEAGTHTSAAIFDANFDDIDVGSIDPPMNDRVRSFKAWNNSDGGVCIYWYEHSILRGKQLGYWVPANSTIVVNVPTAQGADDALTSLVQLVVGGAYACTDTNW